MKKLAVVLAALMMLSTTTFLAAGSPVGGVTSETTGVTVSEQTVTDSEAVDAILDNGIKEDDVEAWTVVELTGTVPADGKVTLDVTWVEAGDTVKALHFYDNAWKERPATVVNGKVVVDFTGAEHFSPVVIVKVTPAPNMYYWLASPFNTAAKLPKTGAVVVF